MERQVKKSSRGFFFTVMALAMLSFMLLTVQVWVRTFEQYDARATQKFKGEALRLSLSTLSDRTVSKFANASAFFALHKLVNRTSFPGNELPRENSADPSNPHTGRVAEAVYELLQNGSSELQPGQSINYTAAEKEAYTLASWQEKIRAAAGVMGFNASFSEMRSFSLAQPSPWEVSVYFEVEMNISDIERTMRQTKTLKANATFPIDGFLDPLIRRGDARQRCGSGALCTNYSERQFFRSQPYQVPSDLRPQLANPAGSFTTSEGYGWFFGPVTEDYPATISEEEIARVSQYVLVHGYDENLTAFADSYGAVILTEIPGETNYTYAAPDGCVYNVTEQTRCLNCYRLNTSNMPGCPNRQDTFNAISRPYMAISGTGWLDAVLPVARSGLPTQKFVLMDSESINPADKLAGYHRIWDITALRDAAVCGFYLQGAGPSFFQRMVEGAEGINNTALGLETFVVGRWAGGADDKTGSHPLYSRLDWEFYAQEIDGVAKIKGMPGCKSYEMCGLDSNATDLGVGRFRLTNDAALRYGLGNISCTPLQCGPG